MKIVFLGASHGFPEPGRRCSCTMIQVGDKQYFIDMGCQAIEDLAVRNIPVDSVKAIFITHMHGDHTDGLISFIDHCNWYYKAAEPIIYIPNRLEQTKAAIDAWLQCNGNTLREFDFRPVTEGLVYDDGTLRITAYKTKHIEMSFGYLVEAEGKRVYFSGDMTSKEPGTDFPLSVLEQPLDLAICEAAHFDATAYVPLFAGNGNLKKLCFNHYSDKFLESVMTATRMLAPLPILRAIDNMEIQL